MLNKTARGVLAAALLAAPAVPAFAETMVREVQVTADMSAIQNTKAAEHWAHLSHDLQNAIMADLVGKTGETGSKIVIDIDEVELSNTLQEVTGTAESRLVGDVAVTNDVDNTKFDAY